MSSTEVSRVRVVVVAVGLAIATLAYAIAEGSTARQATAAQQQFDSTRETVEAEIARTGVVNMLEDNLGDSFGGVWFEPSTAQLHVGVTSPAGRREAEAVAARIGFEAHLTETSVHSTQAELEAAHERWDERLADLFESGDVVTAMAPDYNAVLIELSPSVSDSRRTAIEREAALDDAQVSISVEPASRFESVPGGNCNAFKFKEAHCNPTFVSGVSIKGEEVSKQGGCTAGPVVIRQDRTTNAKATETFVLTAGHCFKYRGGNGKKWSSFNQALQEKEIGKSLEHLIPPAAGGGSGYDVGVIKVESNYWVGAGEPPIAASRAEWKAVEESEPTAVLKWQDPVKNMKVCISGQRSAVQCGTVQNANTTTPVAYTPPENRTVKDVAEVKVESGTVGNGDSGGPWFFQESTGVLLGTMVSFTPEKLGSEVGTVATFQILNATLENLATPLEPLTTKNELRHDPMFWAEKSPATIDGEQTTPFIFTRSGRTVECEVATFTGTAESNVTTATVTPTYTNCAATVLGSEFPATINTNGCNFLLHFEAEAVGEADTFGASTDLKCSGGNEVEIEVYSNHSNHTAGVVMCRYKLGESGNQGLSNIDLTNEAAGGEAPKDWIEAHIDIEGVDSKRTAGTALLCGAETETAGTFEGDAALEGTTEGGGANAIRANTG
jgi:Trypsin